MISCEKGGLGFLRSTLHSRIPTIISGSLGSQCHVEVAGFRAESLNALGERGEGGRGEEPKPRISLLVREFTPYIYPCPLRDCIAFPRSLLTNSKETLNPKP